MRFTQFTTTEKSLFAKSLAILFLWVFYFLYGHDPLHTYLCELGRNFSEEISALLRGCYWGLVIILIARSFPPLPKPSLRAAITIIIFSCVVIVALDLGLHGLRQAQNWLTNQIQPGTNTFWWLVICYALVLAIPFMPGIELGLLLMLMFGEAGILAAYCATVIGLLIPYLLGRALPSDQLEKIFKCKQRSLSCSTFKDNWVIRKTFKHRPIALALAFNLPCNSLIGGGGSIAILTGLQRFVSFNTYILIITLATLPIPLMAYTGVVQIESFLAGQELTQVTTLDCPHY